MKTLQERIARYVAMYEENAKPANPVVVGEFLWNRTCTRAERRQALAWIAETYPVLYAGMQQECPKLFAHLPVTILYTTAPQAYDGFGCEELAVVGTLNGKPLRKIEIPTEHVGWQCARNGSGLHPTYTEAEFLDLLDRPWYIALAEEVSHE